MNNQYVDINQYRGTIRCYVPYFIKNAQRQCAIGQGLPVGWNGNTMYNKSANIEIIRNTRDSIKRSFNLVQSAREEVLRIFSSITAFRRQVQLGVLHLFKESIERGVKVRVLIPADCQQIRQIIKEVNLVCLTCPLDASTRVYKIQLEF